MQVLKMLDKVMGLIQLFAVINRNMSITNFGPLKIPLKDVLTATNNFAKANIIGHGGFGPAYKGRLMRSGDELKIAALRLDRRYGLGDVEFLTEISMLSDLKHPNLVSFVGFCDDKHEKIILIKHMANGSLIEHLNNPNLTLIQRMRIIHGVARVLAYLHHDEGQGRDYAVIHRNVNSSTILLDENWEPKLSGFIISVKQSFNRMEHVVLCEPVGTFGYMDPAIENRKGVNYKSDIYSLGVVLLEILSGKTAFDGNSLPLVPWAKHHLENGNLTDIIHPHLLKNDQTSLRNYLLLAFGCISEDQSHRPDANQIVSRLEEYMELQQELEKFGNNFENLKIPIDDLLLATDRLSKAYVISSRQCSIIYRAQLDHLDPSFVQGNNRGQHPIIVTIQWFMPTFNSRVEERFYRSIRILTSVKHQNIVTLRGFCDVATYKMLVTENLCNAYLINYLGNNVLHILTWEERLKICIDVAYALSYLHDQNMIIHGNINCYNIVLDENWRAKITGFEKAVLLSENQEVALKIYGVMFQERYDMFYIPPDFEKTHKLNRYFDVYSFGIVMFEILCGRKANDSDYLDESLNGLAHVVRQRFMMGTLYDMVDPLLNDEICDNNFYLNKGPSKDSLDTFIKIAFRCIAETQDQRPTMKVVVKELENALSLQDCSKEDRVRQLYIDQVLNELEKTLELELIRKYIHEDRVHQLYIDQVVNELEKTLELELSHQNIHEQAQRQIVGQKRDQVVDMFQKTLECHGNMKIRLADIKLATGNFLQMYKIQSHEDYLFRGALYPFNEQGERHINVAIKRYPSGHVAYRKKEFLNEIEMLTSVKHRNIVTLLGFCVEESEMILVIEKLANHHLGYHLGDAYYPRRRELTWEKRLKICIDVAHALNYLHSEMEDKRIIINRDICCYNIGLDENWGAKIVDFWWSLFLPSNQEDQPNRLIGRPHYQDPDYLKTGKLKTESDVYGFGVVLFEILCGRYANDPIYTRGSDKGLATVARRSFLMGTLDEMIDPIIKEEASESKFILNRGPNKDSLKTFIEIANQCVAETQDQRPTMNVVVKELEKALFFQKNKDNPRISLDDIKVATQNFHNDNYVGGGGFGKVFKGNLQDGKTIVAKRLITKLGQGEQQFLTELEILLEYKHENVIGFVGYCDEEDEKIIIYEYASRGSLDRHLNNASLTWVERLNICIDVASALHFLHEGVGKQAKVIHRDIKTSNILLNHDWKAKLADFGLSLISPITLESDYVIDYACGTPGYLDPLYEKNRFLTMESDIYSFGVVLFELLCGRSTFSIYKKEGHHLPDIIKNKFKEGKLDEVVFEQIKEPIKPKSLATFQNIAYQCLHHEREKRPTMKTVLMELKKAMEFQI
ncbi:hypothetical protein R6Q59_033518 [Mikania micrantha]